MNEQTRKYGSKVALVIGGLVAGGVLATTLSATAADSPTPSPSQSVPASPNPGDPSQPQRPDETLLTGDTAARVKEAVQARYPGATFVRIETDRDGVYEAHITKADGTPVTVELDKSFAITGEEQMGFGRPGGGPRDDDGDGSNAGATT